MDTKFFLVEGDCVAGMRQLPADSVDVVVTSPPYNLGIKYRSYDDDLARDEYLKWTGQWTAQIHRVLKTEGSFFLNIGACPSNPMLPYQMACYLSESFVLQNTIHWIKSITVETKSGQSISTGHFKPIRSHRYLNDCHEYIFHFTKGGNTPIDRLAVGVAYADKSNIARWAHTGGGDKRCRGNTWFIPYQTIQSRDDQRPHPASFPKEIAEQCIKLHGIPEKQVVLDPFLGIGNSALGAKNTKAAMFVGFEIDKDYLSRARELVGLKEAEAQAEEEYRRVPSADLLRRQTIPA